MAAAQAAADAAGPEELPAAVEHFGKALGRAGFAQSIVDAIGVEEISALGSTQAELDEVWALGDADDQHLARFERRAQTRRGRRR